MINKLREIAESREFIYHCGHCNYFGECFCQPTSSGLSAPWCKKCEKNSSLTRYVSYSHADKLAAALKVACSVIDEMSETLKSVEKNQCYDCACGNKAEDALSAAEKMMGEL